jgi:hypothetical protein
MGDSEGGGGDGGSSSPPTHLYVVDYPHHVRVHLTLGRVDKRHLSRFHPLLRDLGLSEELWREFVRAVELVPRITWNQFKQVKGNSPTAWAVTVLCLLSATAAFIVELGPLSRNNPPRESIQTIAAMTVSFSGLAAALAYAARWSNRPFDREDVRRTVSSYSATFAKFGVFLDTSEEPQLSWSTPASRSLSFSDGGKPRTSGVKSGKPSSSE